MSQENVEIVQRVWDLIAEGLNKGDPTAGFNAAFDQGLLAPTSTFTPASEVPGTEDVCWSRGICRVRPCMDGRIRRLEDLAREDHRRWR